jgi:cytoplasmic iron level regulating protein YaaA (DUF328/UPF0246 family)
MKVILSPSKTQDFESYNLPSGVESSAPDFLNEIQSLIISLKKLTPQEIFSLMSLSEKLTDLNFHRFQDFQPSSFTSQNSKPSLLAFQGDVYRDIKSEDYTTEQWDFANNSIRIISGLYGLLKPLDLIQPYRLEMKTKLHTTEASDLYKFWKDKLAHHLQSEMNPDEYLINLASKEYSKALLPFLDKNKVIDITFKDKKESGYKIIAIYAKLARGNMSHQIIQNQIQDPEKLKNLNIDGYKYNQEFSSANEYMFLRG